MNFIHESSVDPELCNILIALHKKQVENNLVYPGVVGHSRIINHEIKKSLETPITEDLYPKVSETLLTLANEYKNKFPWCNKYAGWGIRAIPHIQYYAPNDGFYVWHTERTGTAPHVQNRHLVYMIYLNDVTDGGGTEFYHQDLIVQPVKGKSLIWPADWTYTHRGIPSPTQDKYILTGWFEFVDEE